MKRFKREEVALLTIPLAEAWWQLVKKGVKRELYFPIEPWWTRRIIRFIGQANAKARVFEVLHGPRTDAESLAFQVAKIRRHTIPNAHPEHYAWGEPDNIPYYAIELGEQVALARAK